MYRHNQQMQETGVHLCGRRLYETMVYWETAEESPLAAEHVEFAQIWKALPKVVFSTTLQSVVGNTRLARDGVGTPYFPPLEKQINLELIETRTFGSRVVYLRYRRVPDVL